MITGLVLVHPSSLDSYGWHVGKDLAQDMGEIMAQEVARHPGPVWILWDDGLAGSVARRFQQAVIQGRPDVTWVEHSDAVAGSWEDLEHNLPASIRAQGADRVRVGGIWWNEDGGGCAAEAYQILRRALGKRRVEIAEDLNCSEGEAADWEDNPPGPAYPIYLLMPPGATKQIGPEAGHPVVNGIARYDNPLGSYRYVYYESGEPLSGIQVMSRDGRVGTIAFVWTDPPHRRRGLARKLLERARQDFEAVHHSDDLSPFGELWKKGMGENPPRGDEQLRQLEREWADQGTLESCVRLVRVRLRGGIVTPAMLRTAAGLGNQCATEALGIRRQKTLPRWPWGMDVTNYWAGPWPELFNRVYRKNGDWFVAGTRANSGIRGALPGHLGQLGFEAFMATAASALNFVQEATSDYPDDRYQQDVRPLMIEAANACMEHARYNLIWKAGDMDPFMAARLDYISTELEVFGEGHDPHIDYAVEAARSVVLATDGPDPSTMILQSLNAMANAANCLLSNFWEQIDELVHQEIEEHRQASREGRMLASRHSMTWDFTDRTLQRLGLIHYVERCLLPWLLGFEEAPILAPL